MLAELNIHQHSGLYFAPLFTLLAATNKHTHVGGAAVAAATVITISKQIQKSTLNLMRLLYIVNVNHSFIHTHRHTRALRS